MADLNKIQSVTSGVEIVTQAADAAGDTIKNNDGKIALYVENASVAVSVTITSEETTLNVAGYGDAIPLDNIVVSVPADSTFIIGPFPTARFNDASGDVKVDYDDNSNVSVAAIAIG